MFNPYRKLFKGSIKPTKSYAYANKLVSKTKDGSVAWRKFEELLNKVHTFEDHQLLVMYHLYEQLVERHGDKLEDPVYYQAYLSALQKTRMCPVDVEWPLLYRFYVYTEAQNRKVFQEIMAPGEIEVLNLLSNLPSLRHEVRTATFFINKGYTDVDVLKVMATLVEDGGGWKGLHTTVDEENLSFYDFCGQKFEELYASVKNTLYV